MVEIAVWLVVVKRQKQGQLAHGVPEYEMRSREHATCNMQGPDRILAGVMLIDGKAIAAKVRAGVRDGVLSFMGREGGPPPGLAVVLVGDDPASQVYVRNKGKAAREAHIEVFDHRLAADRGPGRPGRAHPGPQRGPARGRDPAAAAASQAPRRQAPDAHDRPRKDVDGLTPENVGLLALGEPRFVACTPAGVMTLLEESGTTVAGASAVVIGRSQLVGRPMSLLLSSADATVTVCHSKTRDLAAVVAGADIVVAAIGRAEFVQGRLDQAGRHRHRRRHQPRSATSSSATSSTRPRPQRARAITPVPGGVGPMTIAMLAREHAGLGPPARRAPARQDYLTEVGLARSGG